jgi:hypothetical protein
MGLTSNGRIGHLPNPTDVNMDAVVNGFETVTGATTIPNGMVAECRPGVDTCKHTVRVGRDIPLR